jgi:CBS domain-containing protein
MKVKEIMTKEVKSLLPQMTVKEAVELFFNMDIGGLPVISKENKLVGIVTEKDILKNILPTYLGSVGKFVYDENPKGIKNKVADLARLKVHDIMLKDVITVNDDTTICEVAHIMLTQKLRRIPVLDKEGNVVGIAARQDILRALMKEQG